MAAQRTAVEQAAVPVHAARGQIHALLDTAQKVVATALDPQQLKLAKAALAAAERLSTGTTDLVAQSEGYAHAARLCQSLLCTAGAFERVILGYQSSYAWNEGSLGYSSGESWELPGRIDQLLHSAEASQTTPLGLVVLAHKADLQALRREAAELGFAAAFNRALMNLIPGSAERSDKGWANSVTWLASLLAGFSPSLDDKTLAAAAARLVQFSTALLEARGKSPSELGTRTVYLPATAMARIQGALSQLAAAPESVPAPAELFASQADLMDAAGLEGGMQSQEAPPRPNITSAVVAATAQALAATLYCS